MLLLMRHVRMTSGRPPLAAALRIWGVRMLNVRSSVGVHTVRISRQREGEKDGGNDCFLYIIIITIIQK